ncbi:MAG: GIY-YIG nuclease family protein [Candidatus Magasanikbacteria bacterium]|jgi:putative endonuclease
MTYYIYILSNQKNGVLYVGVTNNLLRRIHEHKQETIEGFTQKYHIHNLVYYEQYDDVRNAITREKQIKKWNRKWKTELIEKDNPEWNDLYPTLKPF